MDLQIGLLLGIIAVALVFFSFEWLPIDVVALGVLLALILTGLLPLDKAFDGFGSDTFILILGLLILTASLMRTGVVAVAGRLITRYTGDKPRRALAVITVASATLSAFMSNTASTAFFLPIVIGLARRLKTSASKLLLPLAFSAILASSVTLIATSTNIVVSGLLSQYDQPPIGMFELAPVGIPIVVAGILYMLFIGQRLIPERVEAGELTEEFGLNPYLTEIIIEPGSPLAGKTLAQSRLGSDLDLTVVRLDRVDESIMAPGADVLLMSGDVLLVEGVREEILKVKQTAGVSIKADVKFSDPDLEAEETELVEVILLPRSPLLGRTLARLHFRERYQLQVLAINRYGETIRRKISQVVLKLGDVLLVQGQRKNIAALESQGVVRVLGQVETTRPNSRRAPLAIGIFVGVLILATLNILPLSVAMLLGAALAFITRCITPEEAYREVEWKVLIMIGSMLGLGAAMEHTGTAGYLAGELLARFGDASPFWLLTGFFALTVALTQPMSNQAAAVVVVPVAIQTALQLGLNPRTFAIMIAVAASTSYITPLEPSCLIVYGPGRYRFLDFIKVGSLLTLVIYAIAIVLVPLIWPI
jgi:di/tricarboxylate transporter